MSTETEFLSEFAQVNKGVLSYLARLWRFFTVMHAEVFVVLRVSTDDVITGAGFAVKRW